MTATITTTTTKPMTATTIYSHTSGRIYTVLNAEGLCRYSGKTFGQLKVDTGEDLESMPFLRALELTEAASRARYCHGPRPISKESYEEMLNVLPPENWQRGVGYGFFRLSERLSGSIASFFVRIGDSYYQINEDEDTDHGELFRACMDHDNPATIGIKLSIPSHPTA